MYLGTIDTTRPQPKDSPTTSQGYALMPGQLNATRRFIARPPEATALFRCTMQFARNPLALAVMTALGASPTFAADVNWLTDGDGNWASASNWSSNPLLPGAADHVTLDVSGETRRTATINTAVSISSLASQENLILAAGGSLTLANSSFVDGDLQLSGGTLNGAGTVRLNGANSTWSSGAMAGVGTTQIGGVLSLTSANLKDITSRSLNILAGGTLNWSNTGNDAGRIRTGSGAAFNNAGLWHDQSAFNNRISNDFGGAASSFTNSDTYRKSGAALTDISITFNNSGLVDVQAGTLNISAGGNGNGEFRAGAAGVINFGGPGYSFGDGSQFTGAGAKNINAGAFSFSGIQTGNNLNLVAGSYSGSHTFAGEVEWVGGGFGGGGTTTIADGASFALTGNGLKDIAGRTLTVLSGGTLTWSNASNDGGRMRTGSGVALVNAGQWNDQSAFNNRISNDFGGAASRFDNNGTYTKSGAALTDIGITFNNSGLVDVQAGTLNLSAGGTDDGSGVLQAAAGATLSFGAGFTFNDGSTFSGAGAKNLNGGTFTFLGTQHATNLNLVGGAYQGTHSFDGDVDWTGGTFNGAGTTSVASGAVLNLIGANVKDITTRTMSVLEGGTLNWSNTSNDSGRIRTGSGVALDNAGQWNDQSVFNNRISNDFGGAASSFTNSGTYTKSGAALTDIGITFNNSGLVDVQAGTLNLSVAGSNDGSGVLQAAADAALSFGAGFTFNDGSTFSGAGAKNLNGGTFTFLGTQHATNLNLVGGAYQGTHSFDGDVDWAGGTFNGAGTTSVASGAVLNLIGANVKDITTRTMSVLEGGTLNWSNTSNDSGRIRTGAGVAFNNAGQWNDQSASNNRISNDFGGAASSFTNSGTYTKSGAALTDIGIAFSNTGIVNVEAGNLSFSADVAQHAGSVLTGGTWRVSGNGSLSLNEPGAANIITNQGDVTLNGAAASFARINSVTNNAGALRLLGGRNFTAVGAFANSGTLQLGGGIFTAPALTNSATGEIFGFGTVIPNIANSGRVRASNGVLTLSAGVDGQSGTLQSDAGATLALGATSVADFLVNNGSLALGTSDVAVGVDYTNGNFGEGNTFDARAQVSGSGLVLAAGDVGQALSGDLTGGTSAAPQVDFGHIHVGDLATRTFSIVATGNSGPSLRGALQTTAGGAVLDDARLGGSGATAQNFGPLEVGQSSAPYTLTLNGDFAGALQGQHIAVVNNFDNVSEQLLGLSGAVFRYANPGTHSPSPVNFGKLRVGDVVSQTLTLVNDVPADGFSEALDASLGATSGAATSNGGSVALLGPGASDNSSLVVGINTNTAGAQSGSVELQLASNGAGSSELGITTLASQTVSVSADVYRLASASAHTPAPVVFANRHVGDGASQALSLTNTAANDGFSERLNASIGAVTGNATSNNGSFNLLNAGATDSSSLTVGIDTSSAGHKSGSATINLASDGSGTSGFGALTIGSQTVNVSGDVYRLANASTIAAVQFGNVHVGDVVSQTLSLTNSAAVDGFSESLDAVFAGTSDTRILTNGSISGLAAGATDGSSLVVGLDTSVAGSVSGFATVAFTSNGAGSSGLGLTSLGSQNVGVTTNVAVYRYAEGALTKAQPVDFGAHRVGDVVAAVDVSVQNVAINDGFSEALNASVGSVAAGFTASGAASLIAAGATSTGAITVGLDTSTAGVKSGHAHLGYVSDGAGSSGLGQTALTGEDLALSGRVYAQAVAAVETTSVDFGIVHVGDVVGPRGVTVRNVALGSLTDNLQGSISAVPAGFTAAGTLGAPGLAQGEASAALEVGLDTREAGVFSGNGMLAFVSHNAEMADLELASGSVTLRAQVNNFAHPTLTKAAGDGSFTAPAAGQFVFDFGPLTAGGGGVTGLLALTNFVTGPADTLGADFDIDGGSFALGQFDSFSGLTAGDARDLSVTFDPLVVGLFEQVVRINLYGENASGFHGTLGSFELTLRADVQAVPVPGAVWLFGSALTLLGARRRIGAQQAARRTQLPL